MDKEQKKRSYKLGLSIILGTILLIGVSYAWLTLTLNGTKTNLLKAGTLSLTLTDTASTGINMTEVVPMLDAVGVTKTPYTFTLKNNGTVASEYTIYLDNITLESGETQLSDDVIKYNLVRDGVSVVTELLSTTGTNPNRVLETGVIPVGESYEYDLRLWIDENATNTIAGKVFRGQIRIEANQVIEQPPAANENILAAYTYDPTNTTTLCITGEESTCKYIQPEDLETYDQGTIVQYQVNTSESYYFYVLHDDGNTLTMQQREDTTWAEWYSSESNKFGPTVAIAALEAETNDWANVNDQTYTMGTTIFGNADNAYTGCFPYNSCTTNKYTWTSRTGKARMITMQEVASTGCTSANKSCPIWMYNYLSSSTSYGGTVDGTSDTYWTMSANSSNANNAFGVRSYGYAGSFNVAVTRGVRAVVVVNKYQSSY